jgi:mRNA interferase RelE/StbE
MAWKIELESSAEKDLDRLDAQVGKRILKFLFQRLAFLDSPRSIGEALTGPKYGELWKYRVGHYRIIARIEDKRVRILVVRIGHRRQVYR